MIAFHEMDRHVTIREQLQEGGGPVGLVNLFTVEPEEADQLLAAWAADAAFMKQQPGFISTQLHRGIRGSGTFLNTAVWEKVEHFRQAFGKLESQTKPARFPPSAVTSPHLFRKVAVDGICVA